MRVFGTVRHVEGGVKMPGVTVSVVDAAGKETGQRTQTDNNGAFEGDFPANAKLKFTHVGFSVSQLAVSYFEGGNTVFMFPESQELPGVVVTPNKTTNIIILLALAFVAGKAFKLF